MTDDDELLFELNQPKKDFFEVLLLPSCIIDMIEQYANITIWKIYAQKYFNLKLSETHGLFSILEQFYIAKSNRRKRIMLDCLCHTLGDVLHFLTPLRTSRERRMQIFRIQTKNFH